MTAATATPLMPTAEPQQSKFALSLHEMLSASDAQGSVSEDDGNGQQKRSFQPYHAQSVPKSENLEANATDRTENAVTTVMLRNIPNKYTQNTLLQEINELGFEGTYDFFYLPMDVHNRSNVGYAFINFERPVDAERFRVSFSDHRFQRFHSRKIGSVCIAHVQGLDENLRHFENRAVTQARNDQYRPIVLKGQRRIDIEDAVTEAKARIAQREAAKQGQAPNPACNAVSNVSKPKSPVNETTTNNMQRLEPTKVLPLSQPQCANDARQGLEAAIRDLLSSSLAASPGGSSSTSPAGSFHVPGGVATPLRSRCHTETDQDFKGAAPQKLQQGVDIAGYSPSLYGATPGCQDADADVAQLLSLRSLLVDRLLQKDQATGPNVNSTMPAWSLPPPPGIEDFVASNLKGPHSMNRENEAANWTPCTKEGMLRGVFDNFAYNSQWCTL